MMPSVFRPLKTQALAATAQARPGFTLMEVLVATGVMAIGLAALGGMIGAVVSKGRAPNLMEQAALLANERIQAFRAQDSSSADAFLASALTAAGGSFYREPGGVGAFRPNEWAGRHNLSLTWANAQNPGGGSMNKIPMLFAREFILDPSERQLLDAAAAVQGGTAADARARGRNQAGSFVAINWGGNNDLRVGPNEVPKLPAIVNNIPVALVQPNNPLGGAYTMFNANPNGTLPGTGAMPGAGVPTLTTDAEGQYWRVPMPRTNPHIPGPDAANNLNNPSIRFVREIWVQVNHPPRGAMVNPGLGVYQVPQPRTVNQISWPHFQPAPPYSVVVTVRVYVKEPEVRRYSAVPPFATMRGSRLYLNNTGVGYDPSKAPLAELTAVIAQPI